MAAASAEPPGSDRPAPAIATAPTPPPPSNGSGAILPAPSARYPLPAAVAPPNGPGRVAPAADAPALQDGTSGAAPWPSRAPDDPAELPPLPSEAPCDDPRFADLLARLKANNKPRLWALLRRVEVAEWAPQQLSLIPPAAGDNLTPEDRQIVEQTLQETQGQGFECRVIDDTNRKARPEYTLSGREQLARLHQEARERQAARGDAAVRDVLHSFPRGAVRDIRLDPAAMQDTAGQTSAGQPLTGQAVTGQPTATHATPMQDSKDV